MSRLGINLYQTVALLVIAYTAASLPTNARVLVGAVSQLQPSLKDAARAHGAGAMVAWARGVLPVVSRPIMMAWLFTFCGVFLELPLSQLLYAPGSPPASIAIEDNLSNYHFGVGMAQSVLAVAIALAAVGAILGGYRLLAQGLAPDRLRDRRPPWLTPSRSRTSARPIRAATRRCAGCRLTWNPATSSSCSARPVPARRRCCAAWRASNRSPPAGSRSASARWRTARPICRRTSVTCPWCSRTTRSGRTCLHGITSRLRCGAGTCPGLNAGRGR